MHTELKESVPLAEYDRLKNTMAEVTFQVDQMQKQVDIYQQESKENKQKIAKLTADKLLLTEKCAKND